MTRKRSEADKSTLSPLPTWRVAFYIRLSKEDSSHLSESESVSNQRTILTEHMKNFQYKDSYLLVKEYVDDGISGTTDSQRTSFQEMLSDIKKGLINCVMVKDLARSFRNYSDQGYYLDQWFPKHGVRFISLFHQSLDSYKEPQNMRNISVPIQGILNENHCAETSEKVRKVFDLKRKNGQHIGSFAPYGYGKDPQNHNHLIIDPEAAEIVQNIFHMFLNGMSKSAIVKVLNEHGILCPSLYKERCLGLHYKNPNINHASPPLWCLGTLSHMLSNPMYCGDMVQGRYRIKSYKLHQQEQVPKDEWYLVKNTHQPIVDRQSFELVQSLLKRDTRIPPCKKRPFLFGGFLRCGDCGKSMTRSQVRSNTYYYCRTYKDQSKKACTKHSLKHHTLESSLSLLFHEFFLFACQQPYHTNPSCNALYLTSQTSNALVRKKESELLKIRDYKRKIYEDWKEDFLSFEDYRQLKEDYEKQALLLEKAILKLSKSLSPPDNHFSDDTSQKDTSPTCTPLLTRGLLGCFLQEIKVYEQGKLCIFFNFADIFNLPDSPL